MNIHCHNQEQNTGRTTNVTGLKHLGSGFNCQVGKTLNDVNTQKEKCIYPL